MQQYLTLSNNHFYPRSPCGERQAFCLNNDSAQSISIHALLAESDKSTIFFILTCAISIHALLAESDDVACGNWHKLRDFYPRSPCGERQRRFCGRFHVVDFYPRSPCGERPQCRALASGIYGFLSTLSLRRATFRVAIFQHAIVISIHALLAESDLIALV